MSLKHAGELSTGSVHRLSKEWPKKSSEHTTGPEPSSEHRTTFSDAQTSTNDDEDITGSRLTASAPATEPSPSSQSEVPPSNNWRYEPMRQKLSRNAFRRLTGITQENFDVLYRFLGGDTVCDSLKYKYEAATPKRKKPRRLFVKKDDQGVFSNKNLLATWKDIGRLSSKDKLFMTLVRIRRGFALEDLALIFGISKTHASTVFYVWVQFLYLQFKRIQREMCVSRHDQPRWKIAPCYRRYNNFRIVLDTTEIRIQAPTNYKQQGNTYSSYKAGNVILFLIGISGWGSISYISPGFEGSMSDRRIFSECGLLEYLEPGDLIMVDRGFTVKDLTDKINVTVVHPPFTEKGKRLCPEDNMLTKRIASDRCHVERAIRKIKAFHILKRVTNRMLPIVDQLVYVCACLVNFDSDLL